MERIPTKSEPQLMEAVVQQMQVALGAGVPWLRHVFGKAERVEHKAVRPHEGAYYAPAVYVGGGKYERIVPDMRSWGSYAFFYLDRLQELGDQTRVMPYFRLTGEVSLVVWGDLRDIEREDDRNVEAVKSQLLQVLGGMMLRDASVRWKRVYENCKEVYEEYSIREDVGELTMWPYYAFRFVGEVECNSECELA